MKEDWLHKIHDRMTDFEIDEPENLWDTIESNGARIPSKPNSKRNPAIMIWVKRGMAAAAMLAVLFTLSVYITHYKKDVSEIHFASTAKDNSVTDNATLEPIEEKTNNPELLAENIIAENKISNNNRGTIYSEPDIETPIEPEAKEIESIVSPEDPSTEKPVSEPTNDLPEEKHRDEKDLLSSADNAYPASLYPQGSKSQSNMSVSFYGSSGIGSVPNSNTKDDLFASGVGPDNSDWNDNPLLGVLVFNQGLNTYTEIKHRLPIRAGVSFTYNFNARFGIETGVSYTNLTSDIKQGFDIHYYTGKQTLHYIGIPLNLKYRILSWRKFDLYASAGALAEKCVSAKLDKEYILFHQNKGSESENISDRPMQWSVNASVGIQFNIVKSMGLFVEPGASYYFDDGTDLQTIYKDRPFNFNLNMGIRFNFGK